MALCHRWPSMILWTLYHLCMTVGCQTWMNAEEVLAVAMGINCELIIEENQNHLSNIYANETKHATPQTWGGLHQEQYEEKTGGAVMCQPTTNMVTRSVHKVHGAEEMTSRSETSRGHYRLCGCYYGGMLTLLTLVGNGIDGRKLANEDRAADGEPTANQDSISMPTSTPHYGA